VITRGLGTNNMLARGMSALFGAVKWIICYTEKLLRIAGIMKQSLTVTATNYNNMSVSYSNAHRYTIDDTISQQFNLACLDVPLLSIELLQAANSRIASSLRTQYSIIAQ